MYYVSSLVHGGLVALFAFTVECDHVMMSLLIGAMALSNASVCDYYHVAQVSTECWEPAAPGM